MNYFLDAITHKYTDFSGRARRAEYWMFTLIYSIIRIVLVIISLMIENETAYLVIRMIDAIFSLAIIIPTISITVRRLHDIGKSGYWYFISFITLIGGIWMLILLVTDSDYGTNEWGPNPKYQEYQAA